MAEHAPAKDAGTPSPHAPRPRRNPVPREETTPAPPAAKKSKTDIAIEEAAARLAAGAPPLTEWQQRRIAELFAPAVSAVVKR